MIFVILCNGVKKQEAIMIPEHQDIEREEPWRDEYMKWLCIYAKAHGNTLFITYFPAGTCRY